LGSNAEEEHPLKILIATRNPGKLREYAEMLGSLGDGTSPVRLVSLADEGIDLEVDETGATFVENACLKAVAYARASGLLTLADDSGLEVDALGGAPGVQSARYGGPGATDQGRCQKLLGEMAQVPAEERGARFVCAVAVCTPDGDLFTAEGECRGRIAFGPRGSHGFGYDPVFTIPGLRMTMAQAGPEIKNKISHRAMALARIRPALQQLLARSREGDRT
jgi:XTP/dITP diphosphohydrolase